MHNKTKNIYITTGLLIIFVYIYIFGILERIPREIYNVYNVQWNIIIYTWLTIIYGYILYRLLLKKTINKKLEKIIELIYYKPIKETYKTYIQYREITMKGLSILGYYSILVINNKSRLLSMIILCDIIPRIIIVSVLYYEVITKKGFNYFYKSLVLLIIIIGFNALIYMIVENANTHQEYWENQITIIDKRANHIEVIGNDKEINLYVTHYNIIDIYEALKYLKTNNDKIKNTYVIIYYYYFISWTFCLIYSILHYYN